MTSCQLCSRDLEPAWSRAWDRHVLAEPVCPPCLNKLVRAAAPQLPIRLNGRCAHCTHPMNVPDRAQGGGRTKLYCSPRCRTAAHRARPGRAATS